MPEEAVVYHAPLKRETPEPTSPRAEISRALVAPARPVEAPKPEMPKPETTKPEAAAATREPAPAPTPSLSEAETAALPPTREEPAPARNAPENAPQNAATGLEKQLLEMINQARAERGIAPLVFNRAQSKGREGCMGSVGHAEAMAAQDRLSHDNFPANICLRTNASAENVGYATGDENRALKQVHKAMTESPGHYQNLMNPQFNNVGLGFFYYKGALWVTESFLRL